MKFAYFLFGSDLLMIAVLLIHRFLQRKLPPRGLYALWLIPAIRLMLPFGWVELPGTGMPGAVLGTPYRIAEELFGNETDKRIPARTDMPDTEKASAPAHAAPESGSVIPRSGGITSSGGMPLSAGDIPSVDIMPSNDVMPSMDVMPSTDGNAKRIFYLIWGAGSALCACYVWTVNHKVRRGIEEMERLDEPEAKIPVYCGEAVRGSCLFGLFRPCILMSREAVRDSKLYPYLLRHEQTHYRQKDSVWTVLRIALCVVYWWNPLVWMSAACAQEDGELACDERALRGLSAQERRAYAYALLQVFQSGGSKSLFYETVCAGGGHSSMKKRIMAIVEQHRHRRGPCAAAGLLLIVVLLFGICLPERTNAAGVPEPPDPGVLSDEVQSDEVDSDEAQSNEMQSDEVQSGESEGAGSASSGSSLEPMGGQDGAGFRADTEHDKRDQQAEKENLTYLSPLPHREGYREANVRMVPVRGILEEMPSKEVQNSCDELARRALRALYDLTGYQVEECVYTATPMGTFYFGRSEEDLMHSRNFYFYQFAMEERVIPSFSIASARRVWYSDVQQMIFPDGVSEMSCEELAVWYLWHSGLCPDGYVARTGPVYETEPELVKVTMTDGTFYEVHMDMTILAAEAVYGPYPEGAEH